MKRLLMTAMLFSTVIAHATDGTWISNDSPDNWNDSTNWEDYIIADGIGAKATITNNTTGNKVINLDVDVTLGKMDIGSVSGRAFTIGRASNEVLTFDNDNDNALINVVNTDERWLNRFTVPLSLNSSLDINNTTLSNLYLDSIISSGTAGEKVLANNSTNSGGVWLGRQNPLSDGSGQVSVLQNSATSTMTIFSLTNNTYTGDTTVSAGTLKIADFTFDPENPSGNANPISDSLVITVDTGATLDVSELDGGGGLVLASGQKLQGEGDVVGNLTVATNSSIAPGSSPGTLDITGDLTLDGTYLYEVNEELSLTDLISVDGDIFLGASSVLDVSFLTPSDGIQTFTLLESTGAINGTFGTVNGLPEWGSLSYNGGQVVMSIPEPGSSILFLMLSGVWALTHRRRCSGTIG